MNSRNAIFKGLIVTLAGLSLFYLLIVVNAPMSEPPQKIMVNHLYDVDPPAFNVNRLVKSKFAYSIQDTMYVDSAYRVCATITKALNDSILFLGLDSTKFKRKKKNIYISSKVKVVLLDPANNANFSINSLNTEEQIVDDKTNTTWNWWVKPLTGGEHEIILRATIKEVTNLGESSRDIPVFEERIFIQISPLYITKQFIGNNWQWLAGTILIPCSIWVYKRKKEKNVKKLRR